MGCLLTRSKVRKIHKWREKLQMKNLGDQDTRGIQKELMEPMLLEYFKKLSLRKKDSKSFESISQNLMTLIWSTYSNWSITKTWVLYQLKLSVISQVIQEFNLIIWLTFLQEKKISWDSRSSASFLDPYQNSLTKQLISGQNIKCL